MTKNSVSQKDLYELVDDRTGEIMDKIDKLGFRVSDLENWRSNLKGKIAVVVAFVTIVYSLGSDWIKKQLNLA